MGKTEPMFQRLPADLREEFEMCQCGAGRQDARHFWEECVFLQPLRDEVEARMQELVLGGGKCVEYGCMAAYDCVGAVAAGGER